MHDDDDCLCFGSNNCCPQLKTLLVFSRQCTQWVSRYYMHYTVNIYSVSQIYTPVSRSLSSGGRSIVVLCLGSRQCRASIVVSTHAHIHMYTQATHDEVFRPTYKVEQFICMLKRSKVIYIIVLKHNITNMI